MMEVLCRIKKKFFVIFLILFVGLLSLLYNFNYCLVVNFKEYHRGLRSLSSNVFGKVEDESQTKSANLVQEIAISPQQVNVVYKTRGTKPNDDEQISESVVVSVFHTPKYRFLKQQGLKTTRRLPDALIIGVKKGGTRALLEFIRIHPNVRAAGFEVHFFDRWYQLGLEWYRSCMPPTLEGQITMEKSPSYFVTREVPQRVFRMNPHIKLIVVVRDPVTRAISDYTQAASKKRSMKRFEELAFCNKSMGLVDTSWGPVKIGVYARHLERWLRFFPLSQFLFVSGEQLVVDPAAELARVQDFLGLKRVITEKHFYFNSTKGFPCLMKSEGSSEPHCLGKTKGRNHPYIEPEAIERLREFYRPFNARFYQLTGINFGWL